MVSGMNANADSRFRGTVFESKAAYWSKTAVNSEDDVATQKANLLRDRYEKSAAAEKSATYSAPAVGKVNRYEYYNKPMTHWNNLGR